MPSTDQRPPAIFLMGPTASGKTALACALADRFPVDLVSVDSALVYRGLDLGSAKPDAATLAHYPHRLIDIREPSQPYSAAAFREDALIEMARISGAGRIPVLVGGTGLYFRALERGLSPLPQADPAVRSSLAAEAERIGWPALHARLAAADPHAAKRIRPSDTQRLQRALEVIALTGRPLSELQGGLREKLPWRTLKIALVPSERATLHSRIAMRFDAMVADGFLDEVRRLRADPALHADLPAMRAVGYRQGWSHLDGVIDAATFRDHAVFATRQLAKRQITWLRSEVGAVWFDPERSGLADVVADLVTQFLPMDRSRGR